MEIVLAIVGIGIIIGIIAVVVLVQKKFKQMRTQCVKCKTKFDYDNDVEYTVARVYTRKGGEGREERLAQVRITCTCSECGTTSTENHTFRIAQYTNSSGWTEYNLDDLVRQYMS